MNIYLSRQLDLPVTQIMADKNIPLEAKGAECLCEIICPILAREWEFQELSGRNERSRDLPEQMAG
jgi:hypothetical protein